MRLKIKEKGSLKAVLWHCLQRHTIMRQQVLPAAWISADLFFIMESNRSAAFNGSWPALIESSAGLYNVPAGAPIFLFDSTEEKHHEQS